MKLGSGMSEYGNCGMTELGSWISELGSEVGLLNWAEG